jgi:hypothetical protein
MGEKRNPYRTFVGESEGKRPLGRATRERENHFKMDFKEQEGGCGLDSSSSEETSNGLL